MTTLVDSYRFAPSASLAFLQATADTANASTYTFSAQNLGTANSDRVIIVAFGYRALASLSVSSVTVAGVSASNCVTRERLNAATYNTAAIYAAAVPAGTSGDVVVTLSGGALRCGLALYAARGVAAAASASNFSEADPVTASTNTLTVGAGGFAIATAVSSAGGTSCTWTGDLTERHDAVIESSIVFTGASASSLPAGLVTLSGSFGLGSTSNVGVFAAWNPL